MRRESYLYRTALLWFALSTLGAALMVYVHWRFPSERWPDTIVPWLMAIVSATCLGVLLRWPARLVVVARIALWINVSLLWFPSWTLIVLALRLPALPFTEALPPVEIVLLPSMMFSVVFLPRGEGWKLAVATWTGLALPILAYLVAHPVELQTPRGLHLILALGPVSLIILVLIPLFRGIERQVETLESERLRAQQLAERDALTGLLNRGAGEACLDEVARLHGADVGLVLFDIDHFKQINDVHGHAAGDLVLQEVARRCQRVIRRDDALIRWGGEEFLVLLRGADRAALALLAEGLRGGLRRQPVPPVGTITASFGLASWRGGEPIRDAIARADAAMYAAKRGGRDRVVAS